MSKKNSEGLEFNSANAFFSQKDIGIKKEYQDHQRIVRVTDISSKEFIEKKSDERGELDNIKKTMLGNIYIKYFKKITLLRNMAIYIWPYYIKFIVFVNKKNKYKAHGLIKLGDYIYDKKIDPMRLCTSEIINTPKPKIYPKEKELSLTSPHNSFIFPAVYVVTLDSCFVTGGSNFIRTECETICHDLFDVQRDTTSEELHGRVFINVKRNSITWLQPALASVHLPIAASFVDACAPNYAHWLTEVLPRIAVFCSNEEFDNIPLIVNDGLHENIMQSLLLIAGEAREIYTISLGDTLSVSKLYVTSVAGYVPFERRKTRLKDHSHGKFSPFGFELIDKNVVNNCLMDKESRIYKKVYIKRNSNVRRVINDVELEKTLLSNGFNVVEPEKLSFVEQFHLFRNAEFIVASSGAALANLIFCRADVKIIILISEHKDTSYWYWQNMACAAGKKISYVVGDIISFDKSIHSDFELKIDDVLNAINY